MFPGMTHNTFTSVTYDKIAKNVYIILTYVSRVNFSSIFSNGSWSRVNFSSIFSNGSWSLPFLTTLRIISLKTENIFTEISKF